MSEESVLVCSPCNDNEPKVQSFVDACSKCGCAVWRAFSSPEADIVLCMACAIPLMEQEGGKLQPPTKEQIEELKWWLGNFF
jgi:hypothetical protein